MAGLLQQQPAPAPGADGSRRAALPLLSIGVSAALPALVKPSGGVPLGYARRLVFDADRNLVNQQVQNRQLSAAAASGYELLKVQVVAQQDGYVTAYVGNESNADVYFDDVQVVLGQGLQVQDGVRPGRAGAGGVGGVVTGHSRAEQLPLQRQGVPGRPGPELEPPGLALLQPANLHLVSGGSRGGKRPGEYVALCLWL